MRRHGTLLMCANVACGETSLRDKTLGISLHQYHQFFTNSSVVRLGGFDSLRWEVVSECCILSDRFLHFFRKCRVQTGRSRSERKSYTL
ncbi:hypothetical protein L1987_60698 [Smallanthus sonchifolius]|uniref:Uncharacterized protein n=1 Tax=Smallanthus sonchifolius TaxID=185202 RepID=A0ACB9D8X0_9ASTR|nr:hypothetical protein L1987_60698 [Smallanthus sonchifolius]